VVKPALFTFLPGSDFKGAFATAKTEVARFWSHHSQILHRHKFEGKLVLYRTGPRHCNDCMSHLCIHLSFGFTTVCSQNQRA
jgi:hypothetical protein